LRALLPKIPQKTLAPSASHVTAARCGCRCGQLAIKLRITARSSSQHSRSPQCAHRPHPIVHISLTPGHACHAGPTPRYPQCAHALILLLLYLQSFSLEEGTWGHIDSPRVATLCRARCHPDRLAFKLRRKALRWFIDSRYGRGTHRADAARDTGKPLVDLVVVCIEGTLWTWRRQPLVSPI
jgi:hypothetical protein